MGNKKKYQPFLILGVIMLLPFFVSAGEESIFDFNKMVVEIENKVKSDIMVQVTADDDTSCSGPRLLAAEAKCKLLESDLYTGANHCYDRTHFKLYAWDPTHNKPNASLPFELGSQCVITDYSIYGKHKLMVSCH